MKFVNEFIHVSLQFFIIIVYTYQRSYKNTQPWIEWYILLRSSHGYQCSYLSYLSLPKYHAGEISQYHVISSKFHTNWWISIVDINIQNKRGILQCRQCCIKITLLL
jgi:hypothetical protein